MSLKPSAYRPSLQIQSQFTIDVLNPLMVLIRICNVAKGVNVDIKALVIGFLSELTKANSD